MRPILVAALATLTMQPVSAGSAQNMPFCASRPEVVDYLTRKSQTAVIFSIYAFGPIWSSALAGPKELFGSSKTLFDDLWFLQDVVLHEDVAKKLFPSSDVKAKLKEGWDGFNALISEHGLTFGKTSIVANQDRSTFARVFSTYDNSKPWSENGPLPDGQICVNDEYDQSYNNDAKLVSDRIHLLATSYPFPACQAKIDTPCVSADSVADDVKSGALHNPVLLSNSGGSRAVMFTRVSDNVFKEYHFIGNSAYLWSQGVEGLPAH